MAELPNREQLEKDFAKRFGKVARRHEREFRKLLGDPPDLANVPEEFWRKMEHETERELYPILLLIFDESSLFHGWDDIASGLAAFGWAKQRAENLSTQWVESTRNRLQKGFDKITTPESPELETVATARQNSGSVADQYREQAPFNRIADYFEQEPTKEEVDEIIDSAFGPSRIAQNAVDETTRARHAGGEAAISATVGISELDEWRCQEKAEGVPDDKVCPICRPMNRKQRKDWPWRLDAGPPCHPNDRCWVWYAEQPVSEAIGRMLDDPDYKSMNAIPRFNLKSWYRQIPNAAEWRVHCRENMVDVDDQSEFKSWSTKSHDVSGEARDDSGKWTSGANHPPTEEERKLHATHQSLIGIAGRKKMSLEEYVTARRHSENERQRLSVPISNHAEAVKHITDSVQAGVEIKPAKYAEFDETDYDDKNPKEIGNLQSKIKLSDGTSCMANLSIEIKDGKPVITSITPDSIGHGKEFRQILRKGGYEKDHPMDLRNQDVLSEGLESHSEKLLTPQVMESIERGRTRERKFPKQY